MTKTRPISEMPAMLRQPPRHCTQMPFWFWNGPLDPPEMRRQLRAMAAQQVHGATPHPRFGMDRRAYLAEPFWAAMDATVAEAVEAGSSLILYDEYNWPSGGAGGRVTDGRPDLYPHGLDYEVRTVEGPGVVTLRDFAAGHPTMNTFDAVLAAFLVPADFPCLAGGDGEPDSCTPWGMVGADGRSVSGNLPGGHHTVAVFFQAHAHAVSPLDPGSNALVDWLHADTAPRFIELTHEPYRARYGRHFGTTIPAIFTDEPSAHAAGPFAWTPDFAAEFQRRRGYDLMPHLPALCDGRMAGGAQHRAAFWQTVAELFEERFLAPIANWCHAAGIALTGHIYDEYLSAWPAAPHLMDWLRRFDWPGCDALGPHATAESCKIAASVAHLEQRPHFVCEALGLADGWRVTLHTMKRAYNFLAAMGVDLFIPHAFFQTIDNPRVECPPSFFTQNPYWKYYHRLADFTARLSAFNRQGRHVAPLAVYYPIESLWANSTGGRGRGGAPWEIRATGNAANARTLADFSAVNAHFAAGPYDFDVVDARALAQSVLRQAALVIGAESFSAVLLPAVQTIDPVALARLDAFIVAGGTLIVLGVLPEACYPASPGEPAQTLAHWQASATAPRRWTHGRGQIALATSPEEAEDVLRELVTPTVRYPDGRPAGLLTLARATDQERLWLVVNDDPEQDVETRLALPVGATAVTLCDPLTGESTTLAGERTADGLCVPLAVPRAGSAMLIASTTAPEPARPPPSPPPVAGTSLPLNEWTLQFVPRALDETWSAAAPPEWLELPVWNICPREGRAHGGWEQPGFDDAAWPLAAALRGEATSDDEAVLLRAVLPPGARALRYPLPATGEYMVYVNGTLAERRLGLPPADGELDISHLTHGLGDVIAMEVASECDRSGLAAPLKVRCAPITLTTLSSWQALGMAWYTGRARYHTSLTLAAPPARAVLNLGTVQHYAEVWVNGRCAGVGLWPPYTLDVTPWLRTGTNELVLVVSNSLANRFTWDRWSDGRAGASRGVSPTPDPSGLLGPVTLQVS